MRLQFKANKAQRRLGDAHRNAKEWSLAAEAYRRHLQIDPQDAAIWVQLGHVEKEDGNLAAAEAAYREAHRLVPQDPDPLLHLAHLLKRQGPVEDAFRAFLALLELGHSREAAGELERLQARLRAKPQQARPGAVLFAIQDMFNMFAAHATTSGIQRVQAGVALAAMDDPTFDAHFILNGGYVDEKPTYLRLEESALRGLLAYAAGEQVDHEVLRRKAYTARFAATPIQFGRGTTVVILGSFWGIGNGIDQYLSARRDGVRIIPFIHDIIPVTHPEYCDANLTCHSGIVISSLIGCLCAGIDEC
jgi:tetratricopeptide (TPR) repeat protein